MNASNSGTGTGTSDEAPPVPKLQLGGFQTGGGWGLGDQFARLPPAEEQQRTSKGAIYRVAPTGRGDANANGAGNTATPTTSNAMAAAMAGGPGGRSSSNSDGDDANGGGRRWEDDELDEFDNAPGSHARAEAQVPYTEYLADGVEDDDNTFVDHGSTSFGRGNNANTGAAQVSPAARNSSAAAADAAPQRRPTLNAGAAPAGRPQPLWNPPHLVSRMVVQQPVRDMAVGPDGDSLWVAIGDDTLSVLELKNATELHAVRDVAEVTQVQCLAVVRLPSAQLRAFKTVEEEEEDAKKSKRKKTKKVKKEKAGASLVLSTSRDNRNNSSSGGGADRDGGGDGDEAGAYDHVLWCGMSRGCISIVDMKSYTEMGFIADAHSQGVSRIWYLDNGKVWTAGRDKAVRVWDPQTHRKLKNRNIAAILTDVCYVRPSQQVWAIADDCFIRVYDSSGNNIRVPHQSHDKAENALKMKGDIAVLAYHRDSNVVWVGLNRTSTVLMDPNTYEPASTLALQLSAVAFHKKTAIVSGSGALVMRKDECVCVLDVTSPVEPSLMFIGFSVDGVNPMGMRFLTAQPLAVLAHRDGKGKKTLLSLFTYEETKPLGQAALLGNNNGGSTGDGARHSGAGNGRRTQRRSKDPARGVAVPQLPTASLQMAAVAEAAAALVNRRNSRENNAAAANLASNFNNNNSSSGTIPFSSRAPLLSPSSGAAAGGGGAGSPSPSPSAVATPSAVVSIPAVGSPVIARPAANPSAEVLAALQLLDKRTDELRTLLGSFKRSEAHLSDLGKLHLAAMEWSASEAAAAARLSPAEIEEVEAQFSTPEGRAIAVAMQRMRRELEDREQQAVPSLPPYASRFPRRATRVGGGLSVAGSDAPPAVAAAAAGNTTGTATALASGASPAATPDSAALSATANALPVPVEAGGAQAAVVAQWAQRVAAAGEEERRQHRQQLQVLQRHNRRLTERQSALAVTLARLQQALHTSGQTLLRDAEAAGLTTPPAPGPLSMETASVAGEQRGKFARAAKDVSQALRLSRPLDDRAAAKDITRECAAMLQLLESVLAAQKPVWRAPAVASPTGGAVLLSPPAETVDFGLVSQGGTPARMPRGPGALAVPIVRTIYPRRLVKLLCEEVEAVGEGVAAAAAVWCRVEDMERLAYAPYESGMPDLREDFMQCLALWDLMQAQTRLGLCRLESRLVAAEQLLDARDSEGSFFRQADAAQAAEVAADAVPLSSGQHRVLIEGSAQFTGESASMAGYASEQERDAVLANAADASARLVGVFMDLEGCCGRVLTSMARWRREVPENIARRGAAVGGFAALRTPLRLGVGRLPGVLYWGHVCLALLTQCLDAVEGVFTAPPPASPSEDGGSGGRVRITKDNFLLISEKLGDWRELLRAIEADAVMVLSALPRQEAPLAASGRALADTVGSASDEMTDASAGGAAGVVTQRQVMEVMLLRLYALSLERVTPTPPPLLYLPDDSAVNSADGGGLSVAEITAGLRRSAVQLLRKVRVLQQYRSHISALATLVLSEASGGLLRRRRISDDEGEEESPVPLKWPQPLRERGSSTATTNEASGSPTSASATASPNQLSRLGGSVPTAGDENPTLSSGSYNNNNNIFATQRSYRNTASGDDGDNEAQENESFDRNFYGLGAKNNTTNISNVVVEAGEGGDLVFTTLPTTSANMPYSPLNEEERNALYQLDSSFMS